MFRQGWHSIRIHSPLAILLLLVTLLFSIPCQAGSGSYDSNVYRPPSKHYYYPDHYYSPYNYQSTGDFADHPLVIPPSVPVLRQPKYYYMQGPQARQQVDPYVMYLRPQVQQPYFYPQRQPYFYPQQQPLQGVQQPAQSIQRPATTPPVAQKQPPVPDFVLHAGSFLVYNEADELEKKIKKLGLRTFRREVSAEGITYLQLLVGPFPNKETMKQAAGLLDENLITNRVVVR